MALNDLSTFTQMRATGSFKTLSVETRNVLNRRLSPSINESECYPVRCLVFIEHSDGGRPSLWCAYGPKLKVFNSTTWTHDSNDITFPSAITCMCLDGRFHLWIGCADGQLFVVDTVARICSEQLVSIHGTGGCQTMAFDDVRNIMLTANQMGLIIPWNASNWQCFDEFMLSEVYNQTFHVQQRTYTSQATVTLRTTKTSSTMNKTDERKNTIFDSTNGSIESTNVSSEFNYVCH
jgi:hypothetical protein